MDTLTTIVAADVVQNIIRNPSHQDYSLPTGSGMLLPIAIPAVVLWFWQYSHRKATEPAKPLKLPVLAPTPDQG
jgi:hypothetical protein